MSRPVAVALFAACAIPLAVWIGKNAGMNGTAVLIGVVLTFLVIWLTPARRARLFQRFADWLITRVVRRPPDFVIGSADNPYLLRWWLLPRNRLLNVYLHSFRRPDDDRALHDHPWVWASLMLEGGYTEHTIQRGGIHRRRWREPGSFVVRMPRTPHRVELSPVINGIYPDTWRYAWTLFFTGPRVRNWGFHCPDRGWVPWQQFTKEGEPGETGPGCNAP